MFSILIISLLHHIKSDIIVLEINTIMFRDTMLQKGDKLTENTTKFQVSKCVTCLYFNRMAKASRFALSVFIYLTSKLIGQIVIYYESNAIVISSSYKQFIQIQSTFQTLKTPSLYSSVFKDFQHPQETCM